MQATKSHRGGFSTLHLTASDAAPADLSFYEPGTAALFKPAPAARRRRNEKDASLRARRLGWFLGLYVASLSGCALLAVSVRGLLGLL